MSLTQLRTDSPELFAFPSEGEAFALARFDRLDAAGVVVLDEDAAAIWAFLEREVAPVVCEHGILFREGIDIQSQEFGDHLGLAGFQRYIAWYAATGATPLAGEGWEVYVHH